MPVDREGDRLDRPTIGGNGRVRVARTPAMASRQAAGGRRGGSKTMAETLTNVLVAGYQDADLASLEFDGLIELVTTKAIRIEAAILVAHGKDGDVVVQRTGDHLGRTGAKWGGGVGFLVGLAAPPLLAATVVGAA